MAFQISGIIQHIGNTESIPYQDKVFKKRELVLDCSYRNQFTGQIEREQTIQSSSLQAITLMI